MKKDDLILEKENTIKKFGDPIIDEFEEFVKLTGLDSYTIQFTTNNFKLFKF